MDKNKLVVMVEEVADMTFEDEAEALFYIACHKLMHVEGKLECMRLIAQRSSSYPQSLLRETEEVCNELKILAERFSVLAG